MRIVNYKKFIISVTLLVVVFFMFLLTLCNTVLSYGTPVYSTIYVEYGDTLWDISEVQANTNSYYEGKDIRYVIKDIRKINNLASCSIYPGQELLIPSM